MNANELADALQETEPYYSTDYKLFDKAAAMLRQFGLAESIIKQQQLEIEALKDEVAEWKMSYENNIRFEDGYGHN
jgi:hypothetical protein